MRFSGRVGYVLAGEEHGARELVEYGRLAEQAGLSFLFISDHFHPWSFAQGRTSYLWSVVGALSQVTSSIDLVSAVTCPILRWHPTSLAQAALTAYQLSQGRFILGLGTGERLNEGVAGIWPPFSERLARLEEMVDLLRALWSGNQITHEGTYFHVERAQLFHTVAVPLALAASGPTSARLAGRLGDALIALGEDLAVLECFDAAGGQEKPRWTQLSVSWAPNREQAVRQAHHLWPVVALDGKRFAQLATPSDVERACANISADDVSAAIVCGPDPEPYIDAIKACFHGGFHGVALHAVGPDQKGFLRFFQQELAPRLL